MNHHSTNHYQNSSKNNLEIRSQFLRIFIKQIIESAKEKNSEKPNELKRLIDGVKDKKISQIYLDKEQKKINQPAAIHQSIQQSMKQTMNVPQNSLKQSSIAAPQHRIKTENIVIKGLIRIMPLLSDSAVYMIECRGPDKPLLIYKHGAMQTTSISLQEEEINAIMNEISEKIRIPLVPGVFKAIFNNTTITAVISEFVGTRFIIQKNNISHQSERIIR